MKIGYLTKYEAGHLLKVSPETLKKYRLNGVLTEGLHYFKLNPRKILYHSGALQRWITEQSL